MILFVLPPLTQLNTPYPSITHLTGYLRSRGIEAEQMDLGIELINRLFTRAELGQVFDAIRFGELQTSIDPDISEWGNPPARVSYSESNSCTKGTA